MSEIDVAGHPAREIAPGVWWIPGCIPTGPVFDGREAHVHASQYLVVGSERALLVDAGLPALWGELSRALDEILGDRQLDWVIPTHPEVAHAGDLHRLLAKYPQLAVGGDVRDYHLYYPDLVERFHTLPAGTQLELGGGLRFTVLPALIKDLPNSVWGYESRSRVLFTADGISYTHHLPPDDADDDDLVLHLPGECTLTSSELGAAPRPEQASFITRASLYWTRYVPMDRFFAAFAELRERHPVAILAPAHGNVVTNLDEVLPVIEEAHRIVYRQGARLA